MFKNKFKELNKEYLNKEFNLSDLEGITEYSINDIFSDYNTYDLEIGKYNEVMNGSYSLEHEYCKDDEQINFSFETIGEWEVIDNSRYSNINLTIIDIDSMKIKITGIDIV